MQPVMDYGKYLSTSDLSPCNTWYMSKNTNNFSGDLLLLTIASPQLRSMEILLTVTCAKQCSLREWIPSNILSQTVLSPAKRSLT